MYCGSAQDFEESDPGKIYSCDEFSSQKRELLAPGQKESELLTSIRGGGKSRFSDPLTISLICVSSVLLIAFLVLLFGRPIWEKKPPSDSSLSLPSDTSSQPSVLTSRQELAVIGFSKKQIQLKAGESFSLLNAVEIINTDEELLWSSSDPESISVDADGNVFANYPGASAEISVTVSNDQFISQSIRVICLSAEAEALTERIVGLNNRTDVLGEVSLSTKNFLPGPRDSSLTWDKSLFYSLEDYSPESTDDGTINTYKIEKRKLRNADTGNVIDYEIYRSPGLGIVNKITAIEYLADGTLEITEYYFESNGDLNFVFVHTETSYTPQYASVLIEGQRFYFNGDVMVKWRTVEALTGVRDIVIGQNEKNNTTAAESLLYDEQEKAIRKRYDELELMILNEAYNTYSTVLGEIESTQIVGKVVDIYGAPMTDVAVTLIASDRDGAELISVLSDAEGRYGFYVPSGKEMYGLRFDKEGYNTAPLFGISISGQTVEVYQEKIVMTEKSQSENSFQILAIDAVNPATVHPEDGFESDKLRISGAEMNIREGVNNSDGLPIMTVTANDAGVANVSLPSGCYTVEIIASGYDTTRYTLLSYPGCDSVMMCVSPSLEKGEVRIVLTWDESPADLDAHLFTPFNEEASETQYHVWFRNNEDTAGNRLVGQSDPPYGFGPETITIGSIEEGLYKFYVTDYSNCYDGKTYSYDLSDSDACVRVYTETGLTQEFHVPCNNEGVIWEVFEIRNKTIVPIQRYYSNIEDKSWWFKD
jgi:hypothetical protein